LPAAPPFFPWVGTCGRDPGLPSLPVRRSRHLAVPVPHHLFHVVQVRLLEIVE